MKKLIVLALLAMLFSCRQKKVLSTNSETVRFVELKTERKDTLLPGFTIRTQFGINEIHEREVYDTITVEDPETKAQLKIWKDSYGNLVAQCDDKDQVIERLRESLVQTSKETKKEVVVKDSRSWWQRMIQLVPWWGYIILGFVLGLLIRFRL